MEKKEKLFCKIVNHEYNNCCYEVRDKNSGLITAGTSSSPSWVKNDAGGYHTKEKFDKLYPNGWEVDFEF